MSGYQCAEIVSGVQCRLVSGHPDACRFDVNDLKAAFDQLEDELTAVKIERDEARAGYAELDKNWSALHEVSMHNIREALEMPDASVPELRQRILDLKRVVRAYAKYLDEELRCIEDLAIQRGYHRPDKPVEFVKHLLVTIDGLTEELNTLADFEGHPR